MKALTKILAGGVAATALFAAAPAAAQYYPGTGYGGNVVGQVIGQVLGGRLGGYGGYGGYGGGYGGAYGGGYNGYAYGANSQVAVSQCTNAVQARLVGAAGYGGGYGYSNGYSGYGQGRVLGISRVEPRSSGGLTIRGVATSGRYGAGYGYNSQAPVDLTFKCKTDYRGLITDVDIDRAESVYGSNYNQYNQYNQYNPNDPYAAYGYRRY